MYPANRNPVDLQTKTQVLKKNFVYQIVSDLEEALSCQPLRQSERLNPPSEQEPRRSKCLKQQSANFLDTEDLDAELTVAMVSMIDKIIDPPSVEAVKKLDDWPEWEVSVGCIYASYPQYKSNILQHLSNSFKLSPKHSKLLQNIFLIFFVFLLTFV